MPIDAWACALAESLHVLAVANRQQPKHHVLCHRGSAALPPGKHARRVAEKAELASSNDDNKPMDATHA